MERDEQHPEAAEEVGRTQANMTADPRPGIVADLRQDIAAGHPLICVCDAGRARTQALEALAAAHGELGYMVYVAAPQAGALLADLVHVLAPNAPELDARMARRELAVQLTRIAQSARPIALIDDAHTLLPEDIDLLLHFFPGRRATLVLAGSGNPAIWFTGSGPGVAAFEAAVVYELGGESEGGGGHAGRIDDAEAAPGVDQPEAASPHPATTPRDAPATLSADEPGAAQADADADDTVPDERPGTSALSADANAVGAAVPPWSVATETLAGASRESGSDEIRHESEHSLDAGRAHAREMPGSDAPAVTEPADGPHADRFPPAPSVPEDLPEGAPGADVGATRAAALPARPHVPAAGGARDARRPAARAGTAEGPDANHEDQGASKHSHSSGAPAFGNAREATATSPASDRGGADGIARRNRYLALAAIAVIAVVTLVSRLPDEPGDATPTEVRTPAEATPPVVEPPRLVPPAAPQRVEVPGITAGPTGGATPATSPTATIPAATESRPAPPVGEPAVDPRADDETLAALPRAPAASAPEPAARNTGPAPSVEPVRAAPSPPVAAVPSADEALPASAPPSATPPRPATVEARPPTPRAAPATPAVDREEVARMYAERAAYEWDQGRLDAAAISIARGLESDPLNRRLRDLQVMLRSVRERDTTP